MTYPRPSAQYDTPRPGEEDWLEANMDLFRRWIVQAFDDWLAEVVRDECEDTDADEEQALMEARIAIHKHTKAEATSGYLNREPRERAAVEAGE